MRRTAAVLSALTLVLISCTENPIESAGQGSTDWIGQGAPSTLSTVPAEVTTTTAPTAPRVELVASVGLNWLNDELATFYADTPLEVSELVWDASSGADGFVQAHRTSISRALPGLKFPAAVPDDISHITSQLVFELPMGAMTDDWTAAFGFWTVPPYSESRSIGQSAVLPRWVQRSSRHRGCVDRMHDVIGSSVDRVLRHHRGWPWRCGRGGHG